MVGIEWVIIGVGPSTPTMTHPIPTKGHGGVECIMMGWLGWAMTHLTCSMVGIVWVMMGLGVGWAMGKAGNDEGVVGNGRCRVGYVMVEGMGGSHWW